MKSFTGFFLISESKYAGDKTVAFLDIAHKVDWLLVTEVSVQPISSIFKGKTAQEEEFFDCLTLEDATDRVLRNEVSN